ncbi:MAG: NusG domain II-containing protein [Treponema sp.]|nr:NusG domain II-containing protein [Treponema sp.]
MKTLKPRLRVLDLVLLCLCLAVTVFLSLRIYSSPEKPRFVLRGRNGRWVYPLDRAENALVEVEGPLGVTTVQLSGGRARILSSPCPNQSCIAAGAIHDSGQWIACLPNGVFVGVESSGGATRDIDAAAW